MQGFPLMKWVWSVFPFNDFQNDPTQCHPHAVVRDTCDGTDLVAKLDSHHCIDHVQDDGTQNKHSDNCKYFHALFLSGLIVEVAN